MTIEMLDSPVCEVTEYQPFIADLVKAEEENASLVFDYESKSGNKEARSHIFKLRQSKTRLEELRVAAKAESLRIGRLVDSEAGAIKGRIDKMIAVHQTVLDEIEQREADRVAALQARIEFFRPKELALQNAEFYRTQISIVEAVAIDDTWQEFRAEAALAKDGLMTRYREALALRIKTDADAAELERLRAEEAARKKAEAPVAQPAEAEPIAQMQFVAPVATSLTNPAPAPRPQAASLMVQPSQKAVTNRVALDALVAHGVPGDHAKLCVTLIAKGLVPNVQINY